MNLSQRCIRRFESRDWLRGTGYFRGGAVVIVEHNSTKLYAEVEGSAPDPYQVRLAWSDWKHKTLAVDCTCPRFADVELCKHVAAVIQAADAQGIGAAIPGGEELLLVPIDIDSPDFLGSEADGADWDDSANNGDGSFKAATLIARRNANSGITKPNFPTQPPSATNWKRRLARLGDAQASEHLHGLPSAGRPWSAPRQIWYLLDVADTLIRGRPCVSLWQRTFKKDGALGALKVANIRLEEVDRLSSADDRQLIGILIGNDRESGYGYSYHQFGYDKLKTFAIAPAMFDIILPRLCASGRFGWQPDESSRGREEVHLLSWDNDAVWKLNLGVSKTSDGANWQITGTLQSGDARESLLRPLVLLAAGLVVFPDRIARFDAGGAFQWVAMLRESGPLVVPVKAEQDLVEWLAQQPELPPIKLPKKLQWKTEQGTPHPQLTISKPKTTWERELECRLSFQYGERSAPYGDGQTAWYDEASRRALRRDFAAENAAREQLLSAGAHRPKYFARSDAAVYSVAPEKMSQLVWQLTAAGWQVEAEGRLIRSAGKLSFSVTSGVDWFDLEATCDFSGVGASLPQLLAAVRKRERFIELDDGSRGMLPEEWLKRFGGLAELGRTEKNRLRFLPTQAALLDALLAAQDAERVSVDKTFARWREKLKSFAGIKPCNEPASFQGQLRHYQREGLGWLHFLDEFGFGGCLADDMGLGKTVQVLALLDQRRARRARSRSPKVAIVPSLAIVPRSLVFNWIEEAKRFAPQLRVLNYTGLGRSAGLERMNEFDLIITTYGTLRRDIAKLCIPEFDYAILDEAQAIKNASSQAAKACRLLRARRRLAMSGTPLENHLGELWSLFEFLNPGMLGQNQKLNQCFFTGRESGRSNGKNGSSDRAAMPAADLAILSKALRPFLLRRTKQEVLTELPPKSEQTLFCELEGSQRKRYDELRDHYRQSLQQRIAKVGVNRAKIHVLEALLRLRQAACHPGLLDKDAGDAESAKLEMLLDQLSQVIDEGHKALVFSQFTSFLAIVRRHLDRRKIVYEYLDGKTARRQSKVERFQSDPACPLFLISLKAGGQGLNLTAADYVFILDPWWNPAVEAQAVDRAHRIGQNRLVFAYRLIARDTVEEKILQLQKHKRDLAEAIVSVDNSPLRNLTAEDLQLLLG